MAHTETPAQARHRHRDDALSAWSTESSADIRRLDEGQKWVIYAALQTLKVLGSLAPLRRVIEYLLAHSGMGLGSVTIGNVTGMTDRAIRDTQNLEPKALLQYVQKPVVGHRPPKLVPANAGPLAKFLVTHKKAKVADILAFIEGEFEVSVDRLTLRRFMKKYGLGCLRDDAHEDAPLFFGIDPVRRRVPFDAGRGTPVSHRR